jgi:hypothetical protein
MSLVPLLPSTSGERRCLSVGAHELGNRFGLRQFVLWRVFEQPIPTVRRRGKSWVILDHDCRPAYQAGFDFGRQF